MTATVHSTAHDQPGGMLDPRRNPRQIRPRKANTARRRMPWFAPRMNENRRPFAGLGIGLYITSAIVAQHRGRIWVESIEGEGATFFFEFPKIIKQKNA